jgi:hypothetical protein
MAIDGAWGVVYWGKDMVLGIGAFIIDRDGELRGRDYGGVGYSGTAKEDKDGTITLDIKMSVPAWGQFGPKRHADAYANRQIAQSGVPATVQ